MISFCFPLFKQSGINYPPTSSVPLSFKKGASFLMLSFSQLSYSYVFVKWKKCNILPSFLLIHIVDSTFPHQPKAGGPPFLSRTGNVLHSSRESAFACLLFNKVEEVQHSIVIPSDSHSGINYPPFANADGFETTDCLECLQILNILIYGRRVYFKAGDWILCIMIGYRIPERETYCMLHLCVVLGF